jgi:hypothetical protein
MLYLGSLAIIDDLEVERVSGSCENTVESGAATLHPRHQCTEACMSVLRLCEPFCFLWFAKRLNGANANEPRNYQQQETIRRYP